MHKKTLFKWLMCGLIACLAVVLTDIFFTLYPGEKMQGSDISPSATPAETASLLCKGHHDRPIAYKRLSDENGAPFILAGRPVQSDRHDYNDYMSSITMFPDVRSCLIDSEKEKDAPDLTFFNWGKIKNTYDAEVCLFRVFSSIGTVEASEQWLTSQGFDVNITKTISEVVMSNMLDEDEALPGRGIGATWSTKECGARFGSNIVDKRLQNLTTYGLSVSVNFSADGDVVWVGVTHSVL